MIDDQPENDPLDEFYEYLEPDEPRPFWTRRRLLLTICVIIIVITFLAYSFSGLFLPSPPPPTLIPGSLI